MTVQFNRYLIFGGAAVALLGVGAYAGHSLFPSKAPGAGGEVSKPGAKAPAKLDADADAHAGKAGKTGAGELEMEEAAITAAHITLQTLSPASFTSEVLAQATVRASPDGEAVLTARAGGAIIQIRKRLGDPVARGETVALVTSAEAAEITAALASADSKLDLARSTFNREKRLFDSRITAKQDLEAAQAALNEAEADYKRSQATAKAAQVSKDGASVVISSPVAGRVTFVSDSAKLGAFVSPEDVLFRVADPKRIQVEAAVPVSDARRIAPGDPAEIVTSAGETIAAKVRSVTPGLDAGSRSATVVLAPSGSLADLQPGQFARARIRPQSSAPVEGRFVLPEEAVQSIGGHDVVFLRDGDKFVATQVQIGSRSGGQIEVLSGLSEGQIVAARNAFMLKAELGKGEADED